MLWRGCQIDWHLAAVLHSIDYEAQHRRRLKLAIKSANNNNIYQVLQHKLSSSSRVQENFYATKCKNLLMVEKGRIEFCNLKRSNWIFLKRPPESDFETLRWSDNLPIHFLQQVHFEALLTRSGMYNEAKKECCCLLELHHSQCLKIIQKRPHFSSLRAKRAKFFHLFVNQKWTKLGEVRFL